MSERPPLPSYLQSSNTTAVTPVPARPLKESMVALRAQLPVIDAFLALDDDAAARAADGSAHLVRFHESRSTPRWAARTAAWRSRDRGLRRILGHLVLTGRDFDRETERFEKLATQLQQRQADVRETRAAYDRLVRSQGYGDDVDPVDLRQAIGERLSKLEASLPEQYLLRHAAAMQDPVLPSLVKHLSLDQGRAPQRIGKALFDCEAAVPLGEVPTYLSLQNALNAAAIDLIGAPTHEPPH